ncbi:MAG: lmo0937 family membrane protein [Planctomycetota bacterium]
MLETIIVLLILLWAIGMLSSYTLGGVLHLLLLVALIVVLVRVFSGRRVV